MISSNSWTDVVLLNQVLGSGWFFCVKLTPSALGRGWPLIPSVRNGECVDRRLSHSLGLGSGTASMKFFFSLLMLAWCLSRSSWGLLNSYTEESWEGKDNVVVVVAGCRKRVTGNMVERQVEQVRMRAGNEGWMGRERVDEGYVHSWEKGRDEQTGENREKWKKEVRFMLLFCCFCTISVDLLLIKYISRSSVNCWF